MTKLVDQRFLVTLIIIIQIHQIHPAQAQRSDSTITELQSTSYSSYVKPPTAPEFHASAKPSTGTAVETIISFIADRSYLTILNT